MLMSANKKEVSMAKNVHGC